MKMRKITGLKIFDDSRDLRYIILYAIKFLLEMKKLRSSNIVIRVILISNVCNQIYIGTICSRLLEITSPLQNKQVPFNYHILKFYLNRCCRLKYPV